MEFKVEKRPRVGRLGPEGVVQLLGRLGVTLKAVKAQRRITPLLRRTKLLREVPTYLRSSSAPEAKTFLEVWDSLSFPERRSLPLEAICVASGVSSSELFYIFMDSYSSQKKVEGELLAAKHGPGVVKATVATALAGDPAAQKMLLQHSGFLPLPKTQIMVGTKIDARTQTAQTLNMNLPTPEAGVRRMAERFGEKLALPAPQEVVEELEAEEEEPSD